jgi:Tol biopolymer transport system component
VTVSPDGQWIAFESDAQIWLMRKDGKARRQLTTEPTGAAFPAWSPDGDWIAFVSWRDRSSTIMLMPPKGGAAKVLVNAPYIYYMNWAPDGTEVVFSSYRNDNWDLWAVSVNGGDLKQLTTDEARDIFPAWSPDGRYIAFTSNRTGAFELHLLSTTDGKLQQLTHFGGGSSFGTDHGGIDTRCAWSLDSQTIFIVYQPDPEEAGQKIWAVSIDDGSMRAILENSNPRVFGELTGVYTTDGVSLYFETFNFNADIWLAWLAYE